MKKRELPESINGFKIVQDFGYSRGSRRAIAICKVCNRSYEVDPNKLIYRKHCGCIKNGQRVCKYSKTNKRLMNIYKHMRARCHKETNQDFNLYGNKGIKVCQEWLSDPNNFFEWAFNNGYQKELTIDRIDNSKGYYPANCRWSNAKTQGRNTSRNVLTMEKAQAMRLEVGLTLREMAAKYSVSETTVWLVRHNKIWV